MPGEIVKKTMPGEIVKKTESEPGQKKLKACCACPETKKPRDECIMEHGESNCQHLIEAHKDCMRKQGFKV